MSDLPVPPLVFGPFASILYVVVSVAILMTIKDRRAATGIVVVNALGAGIYALAAVADLAGLGLIASLLLVPFMEEFTRHRILTGRRGVASVLWLGLLWGTAELAINSLPALMLGEAYRSPTLLAGSAAVAVIISNLIFHVCQSLLMASGMDSHRPRYRVVGLNTGLHSLFNFYALFSAALFAINPTAGLVALGLRLGVVAIVLAFLLVRCASKQAADVPASGQAIANDAT